MEKEPVQIPSEKRNSYISQQRYSEKSAKMTTLLVIFGSIFVIFLALFSLEMIGILKIGPLRFYNSRGHSHLSGQINQKIDTLENKALVDVDGQQEKQQQSEIEPLQIDPIFNDTPQKEQLEDIDLENVLTGQAYIQVSKNHQTEKETVQEQKNAIIDQTELSTLPFSLERQHEKSTLKEDIFFQTKKSFLLKHNKQQQIQGRSSSKSKREKQTKQKDSNIEIEKPAVDNKEYRYLELSNKLKVVLVQDNSASVAQVSLNVQVGSFHEPVEFPGLAHFLEHMLFQGSITYPEDFDDLINKLGGNSNAYTADLNTNYFYYISSKELEKTLEVFAHFFIDPTFNEDAVNKEINAVDSEYEINITGDDMKLDNFLHLISDSAHPNQRFTYGNLETLSKEGVVDALHSFFQESYSSNLMTLTIKSDKDLGQLEHWLTEDSSFPKITNKNTKLNDFSELGLPNQSTLGSIVKMNVQGKDKLIILNYQIPITKDDKQTKPITFLNSFINYSGPGGLKDYLVEKSGFIINLEGDTFIEGSNYLNYVIEMQLPSKNKFSFDQRQLAFRLAKICNNYLSFLYDNFYNSKQQATNYLKDTFKEQQMISEIYFKFLEDGSNSPLNDITFISESASKNPIEKILSAEFLLEKFDSRIIKQYLNNLMDTQNLIIIVADNQYKYSEQRIDYGINNEQSKTPQSTQQDLNYLADNNLNERDSTYRIDYSIKNIDMQTKQFINTLDESVTKHFSLPKLNEYIPKDLELASLCHKDGTEYVVQLSEQKTHIDEDIFSFLDQSEPQQIKSKLINFKGDEVMEDENNFNFELQSINSVEENQKQLDKRLDSFMTTQTSVPLVFSNQKECQMHELDYEAHNKYPQLLQRDIDGKIWWKLDRSFQVPSTYVGLTFETAIDLNSIKSTTINQLFNRYLEDKLSDELEPALQAGYSINFDTSNKGMSVQMYGFSSKIKEFFKHIINCMNPNRKKSSFLQTDDSELKRFERAKTSLMISYKKSNEKQLYNQLHNIYLPMALTSPFYSTKDKLEQLKSLQYNDLTQFQKNLFANFRYTSLFVGNILKDDTYDIINEMKSTMSQATSEVQESNHKQSTIDLRGKNIIYSIQSQSADGQDMNGGTLNYYQIGRRSQKSYTVMQLLQGHIQSRAFKYLRTELQLGYVVAANFHPVGCIDGISFTVQGTAYPPYEVNDHIEVFLQKFITEINDMDEKELNELKEGVLSKLSDNIGSLQMEGQFLWDHIEYGDLAFEEKQVAASMIKQITKNDVTEFFQGVFNDQRGKLSLQIYGKGMQKKLFNSIEKNEFKKQIQNQHPQKSDELYVFLSKELAHIAKSGYSCDYQVTNV